jgi:Protein of unknown function (DUF3592)
MATADLVANAFAWIWSIAFLFGLVNVIRLMFQSRKRTSRTTGTVVRVVMRGGNVIVPSPDVEFVDSHGIKHLFKSTFGTSWNQWPIGSRVEVTYDPQDPANCELALSNLRGGVVAVLAVAGIVLVALGVFFLSAAVLYYWKQTVLATP